MIRNIVDSFGAAAHGKQLDKSPLYVEGYHHLLHMALGDKDLKYISGFDMESRR